MTAFPRSFAGFRRVAPGNRDKANGLGECLPKILPHPNLTGAGVSGKVKERRTTAGAWIGEFLMGVLLNLLPLLLPVLTGCRP